MTKDLYNPKDVAQVRAVYIQEQDQTCAITGLHTELNQFVLDHAHDEEQLVRGALHNHANTLLGRIEGLEARYLNHWYSDGLPTFLRRCADYLDRTRKRKDKRYRHPNWVNKAKTKFNALNEKEKDLVLTALNQPCGNNAKQRKEIFTKMILTKKYGYDTIRNTIKTIKGSQ